MYITWFGQSCFKIQSRDVTLVTDPLLKQDGLKNPRLSNVNIITLSRNFNDLDKQKTEALVIKGPGEYEIKQIFIQGIPIVQNQGKETIIVYWMEIEKITIGHLGPLNISLSDEQLEKLEGLDILMVPVGGNKVFDTKKASEIISRAASQKPYMEAKDSDGAIHRLWVVEEEKDIEIIQNDLKGKSVFIADGHHRYETALEFQKEQRAGSREQGAESKPWDYVLMFLANISDEGLTILPAHRLVKGLPENPIKILSEYFTAEELPLSEKVEDSIAGYEHAIGFYQHSNRKQYILKHKGAGLDDLHPALRGLDVTVLHELIFKKLLKITDIGYEMNIKETMDRVKNGLYDAAFFLNPTKVEDVERVALSDMRMPPKSTYFYPKLLTGLVINKF